MPAAKRLDFVKTSRRKILRFITIKVMTVAGGLALLIAAQTFSDELFRRSLLTIETSSGVRQIEVEIAETPAQRSMGLQFRRRLPPNSGMLFDFGNVGPVTMWMKNTPRSLDMLFVDQAGKIVQIEKATKPYSLDLITSKQPVKAVLELLAGTSDRLKIRTGDILRHPVFE